tara:strand:+ start:843 stop:974 length:132 start_codon:yes stop_codon:yes gene_type:complete
MNRDEFMEKTMDKFFPELAREMADYFDSTQAKEERYILKWFQE